MMMTWLLAAAFVFALVPPADAKEGVVARLTEPLAPQAAGGARISFVLEDATGRPFSAVGVFVRVRTRDGRTVESNADEASLGSGRFTATVDTRREHAADLEIGLAGISSSPAGTQRSDMLFPIVGDPFPAAASGDDDRTRPAAYALAAAAAILLALVSLRRARVLRTAP